MCYKHQQFDDDKENAEISRNVQQLIKMIIFRLSAFSAAKRKKTKNI